MKKVQAVFISAVILFVLASFAISFYLVNEQERKLDEKKNCTKIKYPLGVSLFIKEENKSDLSPVERLNLAISQVNEEFGEEVLKFGKNKSDINIIWDGEKSEVKISPIHGSFEILIKYEEELLFQELVESIEKIDETRCK